MEVHIISPFGFCSGVNNAIEMAKKAKKTYSNDIYLLGMIVHNEDVVKELEKENMHIIDERKSNLLDELKKIKDGSIVIYSAHGHPCIYEEIAKKKNLIQIDATCPFVSLNLKEANEFENGTTIYIGSKKHLEAASFYCNCPSSYFFDIDTFSFIRKGKKNPKHVITQTTLSEDEIEKSMEIIKKEYKEAKLEKSVCFSTKRRQDAIKNLPNNYDAILIIGSTYSSNTNKLATISLNKGFKTYRALNLEELKKLDLKGIKKIAVATGASTSEKTLEECSSYLESL